MQIQHLAYLAAVAREGHFGRAAESCHVTQPTLSNGIRRLEEELGIALVRRGHRYEGLTPEGERMLAWAHRILADSDGMQMDAVAMREGLAGRLRLGVIPTALPALTLLSGPLLRRHRALELSVRSSTSREIEQGLHDAHMDVGVTYLDDEPLGGVRTLPLYDERYVLLTAADGPHGAAARWGGATRRASGCACSRRTCRTAASSTPPSRPRGRRSARSSRPTRSRRSTRTCARDWPAR
jgi:DNA-binding transcriptional LysR family regulator